MPKILIFEDEKMLGSMYETVYRMAGFDVVYFEHPKKDPIPTILQEKPDVISTGIIMPELDGFTLVRILKNDPRTKNIPIVGLDNLGQKEDKQKAHDLGMIDYLVMAEHTPREVVARVCELLGLPKPTFSSIPRSHPTPEPPKQSWWRKLFS